MIFRIASNMLGERKTQCASSTTPRPIIYTSSKMKTKQDVYTATILLLFIAATVSAWAGPWTCDYDGYAGGTSAYSHHETQCGQNQLINEYNAYGTAKLTCLTAQAAFSWRTTITSNTQQETVLDDGGGYGSSGDTEFSNVPGSANDSAVSWVDSYDAWAWAGAFQ